MLQKEVLQRRSRRGGFTLNGLTLRVLPEGFTVNGTNHLVAVLHLRRALLISYLPEG